MGTQLFKLPDLSGINEGERAEVQALCEQFADMLGKLVAARRQELIAKDENFLILFDYSVKTELIHVEDLKPILPVLIELGEKHLNTLLHSIDVANKCLLFAKTHGDLSQEQICELYIAGLLHDIGKLAVYDEDKTLLDKDLHNIEGETTKEYKTKEDIKLKIKAMHVEGLIEKMPILSSAERMQHIFRIDMHHHERINGTGYPNHVKGNKLSLSDRILQVADVTSAILENRSYRHTRFNKAINCVNYCLSELKIEKEKGNLDPLVVDISRDLLRIAKTKIEPIKEK